MSKISPNSVLSKVESSIKSADNALDNKIRYIKNKAAANGTLLSGRTLYEINNELISHMDTIYSVCYQGVLAELIDKKLRIKTNRIISLIFEITADSRNLCLTKLKDEVKKASSTQEDKIYQQLAIDFKNTTKANLDNLVHMNSKDLLVIDHAIITKKSMIISVISAGASLLFSILSAYFKFS